ncbi:MAG: M50 family metallopeptidase [Acidimicrobiia bacterium]|jgi:membrane-associated protease RseP (regulator of RpoE activity)
MLGGIAAAVAIVFFVTAHEAGHFLAAKATGMKATEFFFGFGPRLWSTKKGETEYGVKALPLGGYVRIIGMNPLEEVAPEDLGRTYREKKFWEKSVVVLAGVGTNFLIAFIMFWALFVGNGMSEPIPVIASVVDGSPASMAGIQVGDEIVAVGGTEVTEWQDATEILADAGPGPITITVDRGGEVLALDADLIQSETIPGAGFLGVTAETEEVAVGLIHGAGLAGQAVWGGIEDTFYSLYQMFRPSSLAQYFGVFGGDTDVPDEIRPVSPIGIVSIGSQTAGDASAFFGIMAYINVILATINLLPLFPLDGGHFAVALYEKITGRAANIRKLMPVAAAVIGTLFFLGFVAIILDLVDPISFG